MKKPARFLWSVLFIMSGLTTVIAQEQIPASPEPLGIALENYDYPFVVHYLDFEVQGVDVRMAYMDIEPFIEALTTFLSE